MKLDAMPPIDPAVERVLAEFIGEVLPGGRTPADEGAWRRAALRQGVEREEGSEAAAGYAFPPRSTRGATRA